MTWVDIPRAGASGQFIDVEVPGGHGHAIMSFPQLWRDHVDRYREAIGAAGRR
jgi:hypothetical protein